MRLHAYEAGAGSGAPAVLLHGLFGRAQNLGAVARHLAQRRRVISLDMRNHGASPHGEGMGYAALAGDVLETLDAMGALPAVLIGHSMGGKAAMAAALMAGQSVRGLLVGDIAPRAYAHNNAAVAAAMRALPAGGALSRAAAAEALAGGVPEPAVRQFLLQNFSFAPPQGWRIGLDQIASGMADIESWPDFGGAVYEGPVRFVAGGQSDYVTPADFAAARAMFPRSALTILRGAGHWLHADRPKEFLESVENFVDLVSPN